MSDEKLTYLADVEVIADACETMLKNSKIFEDIAQGNPTLAQKIKDKLKNFIARLKQLLNKTNALTHEGKLLEECVTEFENIQKLWDKAVTDGIKTANAMHAKQKNNTADNSDVRNQLRSTPEEKEIAANIKAVSNMKPVATLSGSEFSKSKTDLVTQVTDYFDEIGGYVNTEYGKIELTKSGVKSSIGHGIGRNKAIAFKAVPDVLKEGKIIDFQKNWKNRGYDTAVFAAPIKIADKDYFMAAVIVVETERNSYYLHEVAIQEKEDNTLFKTGTVKNGTSGKVLSSPIFTLLQKLQSVKNESEDNTEYQSRTSELDNEYLDAVKNNDLETAQRLVEEAAKKAGYDSPLLYHGTKSFGFTEFDLSKMDDGKSIFLTDSKEIASTYSGVDDLKKISERINIDVDKLTSHKTVELLNKYSEKYNYKYYSESEVEKLKSDNNSRYGRRLNRDNISGDIIVSQNKKTPIFYLFSIDSAKELLKEYVGKGNYSLYAKLNNPYVVECDGSYYNDITYYEDLPDELKKFYPGGLWRIGTTREAAEYAKDNGYDSVIFKNIKDNGGRNSNVPRDTIANVYVVFNPNNVKSADPITYDDNGNVIPLSERFKEDKSDIRYQSRNTKPDYNFRKALNNKEWGSFYASVIESNQRDSFRIGDNGVLIPNENYPKNYKFVCYEGDSKNPCVTAVYKLLNYDYTIHDKKADVTKIIIRLEKEGYNDKHIRAVLQNYTSLYGPLFERYNRKSGKYIKLTRKSVPNREDVGIESDGTGISENAEQGISDSGVNDFPQFQMRTNDDFLFDDKINKITQSQQFIRWFGDWQNHPETASKVVDGNGESLVVYHQTKADFTIFNTDNERAGLYDSDTPIGMFFKTTDKNIGLAGNKQMAVYLNAKNVLTFNNRDDIHSYWMKNVPGYVRPGDETVEVYINAGEQQVPIDLQEQEIVFARRYMNHMLFAGGVLIVRRNLQ